MQIGVHGQHPAAAGMLKPCDSGGVLSVVAPQPQHADAWIGAVDLTQNPEGTVAAAIIDEDNLVGNLQPLDPRSGSFCQSGRRLSSSLKTGMTTLTTGSLLIPSVTMSPLPIPHEAFAQAGLGYEAHLLAGAHGRALPRLTRFTSCGS